MLWIAIILAVVAIGIALWALLGSKKIEDIEGLDAEISRLRVAEASINTLNGAVTTVNARAVANSAAGLALVNKIIQTPASDTNPLFTTAPTPVFPAVSGS